VTRRNDITGCVCLLCVTTLEHISVAYSPHHLLLNAPAATTPPDIDRRDGLLTVLPRHTLTYLRRSTQPRA